MEELPYELLFQILSHLPCPQLLRFAKAGLFLECVRDVLFRRPECLNDFVPHKYRLFREFSHVACWKGCQPAVSQWPQNLRLIHPGAYRTYCTSLLLAAAKAGDLEYCQWHAKFFVKIETPVGVLLAAASRGHLHVCKWAAAQLGDCDRNLRDFRCSMAEAWANAAKGGHMDVCVFLDSVHDFSPQEGSGAMSGAALSGHWDICKWLRSKMNLDEMNIHSGARRWWLVQAAKNGNPDMGKWFVKVCELSKKNVRKSQALCFAAAHGNVSFCKWLAKDQGLHKGNVRMWHAPLALANAAECGHLATCQWLTEYFELTASHARFDHNKALRNAAANGHLHVCEWLTNRFALTPKDAREKSNQALRSAAGNGHVKMCQWLTGRFGLTASDAAANNHEVKRSMYTAVREWYWAQFSERDDVDHAINECKRRRIVLIN